MKALISSTLLLALTSVSYAQPQKCPSTEAILALGLERLVTQPYGFEYWFIDITHTFDTTNMWNFILAQIYATNTDEATKKAFNVLSHAKAPMGPFLSDTHPNEWYCLYNAGGYNMMTITTEYSK